MNILSAEKKLLLTEAVKANCLTYGDFPLSGGGRSHYFIDGSKLWTAEGLHLVVECLWEVLQPLPHQIGGPSVGADPIVGGMLLMTRMRGQSLNGFVVKKDGSVEGVLKPGQPLDAWPTFRTVIVEDVVTTGTQVDRAAQAAEWYGATITGVVALVDREAGAGRLLERWNYYPLLSVYDLGIMPAADPQKAE